MKRIINTIKKFTIEKKKAFTLIEVMGVLVIIGLLTVILIPVVNNIVKSNEKDLYNKQLDSIRLAAKNLASDNMYILPEEEGEEIYITLGQLRSMGYAEEKIINPKTKENFPDSLIVMIIKKGNDYNYDIILNGDVVIVDSDVQVTTPSKKYIKEGIKSSYIITAKTDKEIGEKKAEYYIDIREENINLLGAVDKKVKYKVEGNNGLYKLTVIGGEEEGSLYFNFKDLKDIEGKEVNVTDINNEINDVSKNKQIIVDNTAPTCSWSGENETWTNNQVSIILTGLDNYRMNSSRSVYTKTYNQSGIEIATDNLSYEIEDAAGNKNICSKSVNVYYDKKGPTKTVVDFNSYTINTWTNQTVNRTFSATDGGSGVDHYEWSNDCVNVDGTESSNSSSITLEGINTTCHRAIDKAGNVGDWSNKNIVKIDKTAPSAPDVKLVSGDWTERNNNTWYNFDIAVSGKVNSNDPTPTSTDSGSGIKKYQISKDNKNWYDWSYSWSSDVYKINSNGTSYRYIRAIDNAGNISAVTTKTIKIDKIAPTVGTPSIEKWYSNSQGTYMRKVTVVISDSGGSGLNESSTCSYYHSSRSDVVGSFTIGGWSSGTSYYAAFGYSSNSSNILYVDCDITDGASNHKRLKYHCTYSNNTCTIDS